MQDLRLTLIQSTIHWEAVEANLAMFEEKIWQIKESTDIIVLPEMFNTGFTMNVHTVAERMNMRTFKWMKQMAEQTGALVLGSFITSVHNQFYNRLIWMEPSGLFKTYDKRHLFRMAGEQRIFTSGRTRLIATWKGWVISPFICYDLRFPVWSRNNNPEKGELPYDLSIYVANWPIPRMGIWETLLKARAIENTCYTVGVNRVGTDGNGMGYNGSSMVVDPTGNAILNLADTEAVKTIKISKDQLQKHRDTFPTYMDADNFSIEISESIPTRPA